MTKNAMPQGAMRALRIEGHALAESASPIPSPRAGEILIRVSHAGVNRADLFQLDGTYPAPEETGMIPGLEVSGAVEALGDGVAAFAPGDKVCALLSGGGYAEYCVAPASQTLPLPRGLTMAQGATLPEALATVWMTLFLKADLRPGETLLVHGGASGVGVAALQLAALFGARVLATAGTVKKCASCAHLGATAINYRTEDFVARVKTLGGADVVLDMVGGDYVEKNIRCLKYGGRLLSIAFLNGARAEANFGGLLMKNLTWFGLTLRSRQEKAAIMMKLKEKVWPFIEGGRYTPVLDSVFPLAEAGKAHARMRECLHIGKMALEI